MVASAIAILEALPQRHRSKMDRHHLPAPEKHIGLPRTSSAQPWTLAEELLASIVADVLQIDQVDINDNFFELGGHSLLAMRLAMRLQEVFHTKVSLNHVFETPTVSGMARALQTARDAE